MCCAKHSSKLRWTRTGADADTWEVTTFCGLRADGCRADVLTRYFPTSGPTPATSRTFSPPASSDFTRTVGTGKTLTLNVWFNSASTLLSCRCVGPTTLPRPVFEHDNMATRIQRTPSRIARGRRARMDDRTRKARRLCSRPRPTSNHVPVASRTRQRRTACCRKVAMMTFARKMLKSTGLYVLACGEGRRSGVHREGWGRGECKG